MYNGHDCDGDVYNDHDSDYGYDLKTWSQKSILVPRPPRTPNKFFGSRTGNPSL